MPFWEILKTVLLGFVEGVTEWLPISSTGHMILLGDLLSLQVTPAFWELFEVTVQLGAILAVAVRFWERLNPFSRVGGAGLWGRILLAVLPSALVGLALDDFLTEHFYHSTTVAVALIAYGIAFLLLERRNRGRGGQEIGGIGEIGEVSWKKALGVGAFQTLALIPGTSRSGATILGGVLLGLSRPIASEFSFYLAIPTMAGAGLLKGAKYFWEGNTLSPGEIALLLIGSSVAFAVSMITIRFLMDYVRRHSFAAFGVYRILLGILVLGRALWDFFG